MEDIRAFEPARNSSWLAHVKKTHSALGLQLHKSAPACKKVPALLLCFITGLLIKMSRKYSPAWKPLRKGSRELTWKEEEVGGERECRAAIPERPWGMGWRSPWSASWLAETTALGMGSVETRNGF